MTCQNIWKNDILALHCTKVELTSSLGKLSEALALIEERRTKYYKMLEIFTEAEVDSNNMECLSQQIWIYKQQREYA